MARHAARLPGTFEERCRAQAEGKRVEAMTLPPGRKKDDLLAAARQIEIASGLEKWIASPGVKQPT